ncbi:hypothetical protein HHK36_019800 [Tetracentron sinense]|uniref:AAA+ ATPase domain-containing protein n=1 Tax=Tetracentron sinense TaxID=13715 RepID=A0A834YZP5_TETSI|nr:hypothetical protein HHK36_019800 [Tetracentron sinense]
MDFAMEFLGWISDKMGEYLVPVAPIGRQLGYLIHYNSNVENLTDQVEKLKRKRNGVQRLIDAAKRNGEDIRDDVKDWLTKIDEITEEVETLNDNVVAPNWSSRYRISKKAKKNTFIIEELQRDGEFNSVSFPTPPPGIEAIPTRDFMVFKSTEWATKEIMEALKDDNINIIGLYGVGGVGKTTLVKQVGKQAKEYKLFDQVVMAVVSQPPEIKNIQEQIAEMLGLKFSEMTESVRAGRLSARLTNEKRSLIIMDDVWERLDLDAIGIPFGGDCKDCKILLTTRSQDVCNAMGSRTRKIGLNALSEEESWALFQINAGTCVNTPDLNVVAREVAGKCGGLPIALVTVGRALVDKDLEEWKKAARRLKESKPTNEQDVDHEVFSCLRLSYDYLKGEETKACFLLCCLFPEDHEILIEDLARYGMGQGLFQDVNTMDEARGRSRTAIKKLKASCLLLDCFSKEFAMDSIDRDFIKMHDVVRHAAKTIASKDNNVLVRAGEAGLKKWPNKGTFEHKTCISVMDNDICNLPGGLKCPKLQTLLLQRNYNMTDIPDSFFEGMTALQVLDLSSIYVLSLPTSIQFLTNLRTLCLDWSKRLRDISMLGELHELEILSISYSDIKEFPNKMRQLTKLRFLDLTECGSLVSIPPNVISSLSRLEELYMGGSFHQWEIEGTRKISNASIAELQSLHCLDILSVTIPDVKCFPKDFLPPNIISFCIYIGSDCQSLPKPTSRELNLAHAQMPLVDGIKVLLERTEHLSLDDIKGLRNIHLAINREGLNGLKSLDISNCKEVEYFTKATEWIPQVAFCSLEKLKLKYLPSLKEICGGQLPFGSLLKLSVLKVGYCEKLLNVLPINLSQRLQNLEALNVSGCNALKEVFNLEERVEGQALLLPKLRILKFFDLPVMYIWKGPTQFVCLHNLKNVTLWMCNKLRNIFSSTQARNLLQLETIEIVHCSKLEVIVSNEEDKEGEEIVFPQLYSIKLRSLPNLTSFCQWSFASEWPSLEEVIADDYPNLENFFATSGFQNTPKLSRIVVDDQDMLWHFKGNGKEVKLDHGATSQEEIQMVDKEA